MDIRFTFDDQLSPGIERAVAAHQDFEPAMIDIEALMLNKMKLRFIDGEGPDGAPWLPSHRAIEEGGQTLIDTRALFNSLTGDHDSFSAVAGTNMFYARPNQEGVTIRPRTDSGKRALKTPFGPRASVEIPARPFAGFGADEMRGIPEILVDFLSGAWAGGAV